MMRLEGSSDHCGPDVWKLKALRPLHMARPVHTLTVDCSVMANCRSNQLQEVRILCLANLKHSGPFSKRALSDGVFNSQIIFQPNLAIFPSL